MCVIILPLPPVSLKTNRVMGQHWGSLQQDKQRYVRDCWVALRDHVESRGHWSAWSYPVHLTATVYLGKGQRADPSDVGGWTKVAVDQLVEAGVLIDDGSKYVASFTAIVQRDPKNPRLEIAIHQNAIPCQGAR